MKNAVKGAALPLIVIVLAYLAVGALYAVRTPAWQVPDEPAHYNAVAQVARDGCCPVIAPGDWDNAYLEAIKAARFSPESLGGRLDSVQYEDHQPPLYYLLASLVFRATDGDLIALRLFSVLLGAGVVTLAWAVARAVFPARPWIAVGAAAFVAFLPQHLAMMAGVNNDPLAEVVAGGILLACVTTITRQSSPPGPLSTEYRREGEPRGVAPAVSPRQAGGGPGVRGLLLGVLLGIGFLTKLTVYPLAGAALATVLLRARRDRASVGRTLRRLVIVFGVAALIAAPFWLRNLSAYGGTDFLAQAAHDRVVVGQPQTGDYVARRGLGGWLADAAQITFQSFWGQFGWMGVPMSATIYTVLLALTLVVLLGAALAFVRGVRTWTADQHHVFWLLFTASALVFGAHVYYNLRFVQFQGRYLYPALIPIALAVSLGVTTWADVLAARIGGPNRARIAPALASLFALAMLGFAVYALFRIILPALA
ncbi:MAG: glycosyltransferase family 39 protein [Anaerolineae bacterium]|nr:glycosyltransferase family 39 protein [Anaerolineae bacterium]